MTLDFERHTLDVCRFACSKGCVRMSLKSLIATGTKVWLDSIDPDYVEKIRALGGTGATSNPIIISDLIKTGRFDDEIVEMLDEGSDDEKIAWEMTDHLVHNAQE